MHILDIFRTSASTCSFEFFPPKTEKAASSLYTTLRSLERLEPSFVSVTYGAGGSSRQLTHDLVERIHRTATLTAIPHLTCIAHPESEVDEILGRYAALGVSNILALGGDVPTDRVGYDRSRDAFRYGADLVRFIQRFNARGTHGDPRGFGVGVAGYPEGHPATPNRFEEMDFLKAKVDAGAEYIVTQMFFDNKKYFEFVDLCRKNGIDVPIIPGLKILSSKKQITALPKVFHIDIPQPFYEELETCKDDKQIKEVGIKWCIQQSKELVKAGVPCLHFYTMGASEATKAVAREVF